MSFDNISNKCGSVLVVSGSAVKRARKCRLYSHKQIIIDQNFNTIYLIWYLLSHSIKLRSSGMPNKAIQKISYLIAIDFMIFVGVYTELYIFLHGGVACTLFSSQLWSLPIVEKFQIYGCIVIDYYYVTRDAGNWKY